MLFVDIETNRNGKLLAIGACTDTSCIATFKKWEDVFKFASVENKETTWIAHNGGGFDWLHLLDHVIKTKQLKGYKGIVVGNRVISMTLLIKDMKQITLIDSFNLWPVSLNDAALNLTARKKIGIDKRPEDMKHSDMIDYLANDVSLLRDCYHSFNEAVLELGYTGEPRITIASTALAVFEATSGIKIRGVSDFLNNTIAECYTGGRVQVFKPGVHENISVYDVNSMYPYVMANNVYPIDGEYDTISGGYTSGANMAAAFIHCDFSIAKLPDCLSPIMRQGKPIASGSMLVSSPEFLSLNSIGAKLKVNTVYSMLNTDYIFRDYINKMYSIKIGKSKLSFVAKLLMNSLYGKYGQNPIGSELVLGEQCKSIVGLTPLGGDIFERETEREVSHRHVAIASLVTAHARVKLWKDIYPLASQAVYCDTDSIHTTGNLPTGKNLGDYKLEFEGKGIYLGKKLYTLIPKDGSKEKIVAKGIRHKDDPVYHGNMALKSTDFSLLAADPSAKILCEFDAMPTLREVLSGECTPCKPIRRQRRIRQVK